MALPHPQFMAQEAAASLEFKEWTTWSARPETAPRTYVENGVLVISGNSNVAEHGGWERRIDGVEAGKWYRFSARYRAEAVTAESWQVVARLDWRSERVRATEPDYVYQSKREGEWTRARGYTAGHLALRVRPTAMRDDHDTSAPSKSLFTAMGVLEAATGLALLVWSLACIRPSSSSTTDPARG